MKEIGRLRFIWIFAGFALIGVHNCKPVEQELQVKVETGVLGEVGFTFAIVNGKVVDAGDGKIEQHGFCYGTSENPTIVGDNTQLGARSATGDFSDSITNLLPGTTYYLRVYAIADDENYYGDQTSFITLTPTAPVVAIESVGDYENDSVTVSSTITDDGGSEIIARGVCWSLDESPDIAGDHRLDGSGTGSFTSTITGLMPDTVYYIRAYATSAVATSYSAQHQVTTPPGSVTVTTAAITGITTSGAVSGGTIVNEGASAVTERGVCWSTSVQPDLSEDHTSDGSGSGSFTSSLSGLSPSTTYYVRAYAVNESGTYYGDQVNFTTTSPSASLPVLTTNSVTSITASTAVSGGSITDDGGSSISARGVCWSTSHNPDLSDGFTTDGTGIGTFTSAITDLASNTIYYVRAYATNSEGTTYGNEVSFTSISELFLPTLSTVPMTSISETSAVGGGNITDDGGSEVTARGVCWSTLENPDISGDHTEDGSGTGIFTSSLPGLISNTTYYVRAYATNELGTSYGSQVSFTTSLVSSLPVISTSAITTITETSAEGGGNVTDEGGSSVIARGICWGTSHNPDLSKEYTTDGTGSGSFTSSLTGLESNTTYYVRAYATNGSGTAYGNEQSFTTTAALYLPTLTTNPVTSITENSAASGGNITDSGGSEILVYGVCWSTDPVPEASGNHTSDGSGSASFTSAITGLNPSTTYYVRAYATNEQGTAYGNEVSFTTSSSPYYPTLSTAAVSEISSSSARCGGDITDDGGSMVTERGLCWSLSNSPEITDFNLASGAGTGTFSIKITGLDPNTTYYVRAYATNAVGTAYGNEAEFTTTPLGESVTDIDGNVYQTVVIGYQTWMGENLKVSKYKNGDPIPQISDLLDWNANDGPAFCYYDNDFSAYGDTYGALYNWFAVVDSRGLCPSGWHVPSSMEWDTLAAFVGGQEVAGAKLKEVGTDHWNYGYATDEFGFTALPGGYRVQSGSFYSIRDSGYWWTSTENSSTSGRGRYMKTNYYDLRFLNDDKGRAHSIRCVKD